MTARAPQNKHSRVIRASEVGAYSYCAHAWWLGSVKGRRSDNVCRLRTGRAAHERHGRQVILGVALTRLSYVLLMLTGLAGLGWLVSLLAG